MVKKVTSGKREREKQKQSKREEKLKRKEERQNSGGRTFEEMLAYVDEYGVLHSAPELITKGKEVNPEEIQISIPKKTEEEEVLPLDGRIEYFNPSKGYGFVKDVHSTEKYFFHISNAPSDISEGNLVKFELESGARGLNAVRIVIIK